MRNLVRYLYGCLRKQDPPISQTVLERVIRDERNDLLGLLDDGEWQLIFRAVQSRSLQGESDYNSLLRSLFLYEYRNDEGRWVDINPVLAETEIFKRWQAPQSNP
jgi:hypothetical protein